MKPKNPEQRREQYKAMCQDMVKPIMIMQMINMERLTFESNEGYAQNMSLAFTRLGERVTIALEEATKGNLSKLDDFLDFVDAIKKMEVTSDTVDTIEERFDVGAIHLVITDDLYKKMDKDFNTLQAMNESLDTTQWN